MKSQFCSVFARGRCSGCTALHMPYPEQLSAKEQFVRDTLAKVISAEVKVLPIAASPLNMTYRTSAKLCLHEERGSGPTVGLYYLGTKEVTPITSCPAQTTGINKLVATLFQNRRRIPAPFYNHKGRGFQRGKLKFLTVRAGPGSGLNGSESHALIVSHTGVPRRDLMSWLQHSGLGDVCAYESLLTPRDGQATVGSHKAHLSGPAYFPLRIGQHTFQLPPTSFFQANHSLSPTLIDLATKFEYQGAAANKTLQHKTGDVLLDLYGGFGAYSFTVAPRFHQAIIVDGNSDAIAAATRMAANLKLGHISAFSAYCEDYMENMAHELASRVTHIIVNPPRGGLSRRALMALSQGRFSAARSLNYVSCSPEALARDLELLVAPQSGPNNAGAGWRLVSVQAVDMFPQTEHVEVVAKLVRSDQSN